MTEVEPYALKRGFLAGKLRFERAELRREHRRGALRELGLGARSDAPFAQGVGAGLLGAGVNKLRLFGVDLSAKVFGGGFALDKARTDEAVVNLAKKLPWFNAVAEFHVHSRKQT